MNENPPPPWLVTAQRDVRDMSPGAAAAEVWKRFINQGQVHFRQAGNPHRVSGHWAIPMQKVVEHPLSKLE